MNVRKSACVVFATSTLAATCATSWAQLRGPDFNHDGYADIVAGTPDEDMDGLVNAGIVHVMYGANTGLGTSGNQIWHLESPGILGESNTASIFGNATTWGDFNRDGFDDMAIAARGETINGKEYAGAVHVMFGSASGIRSQFNHRWHEDNPGLAGWAQAGAQFGHAVAAGDFNGDGFVDLVIGAATKSFAGAVESGVVHVMYSGPGGPRTAGRLLLSGNTPAAGTTALSHDMFGASLATGDFNDDGYADLAIGIPGKTVEGQVNAGAVQVYLGSPIGLKTQGNKFITFDSPGVIGVATAGDALGTSLATGDFNGDHFMDLAIGAPGKSFGGPAVGAVLVLRGSSGGLIPQGSQIWFGANVGAGNDSKHGDLFGWRIASGDFNKDGRWDLVIGIPGKVINGIPRAGATHILYGNLFGLWTANSTFLHEAIPTMNTFGEAHARFGYGVACRDFNGDGFTDLAIGSPYHSVNGVHEAGQMHVLYGGPTGIRLQGKDVFSQATPGMEGEVPEPGDEFADYF